MVKHGALPYRTFLLMSSWKADFRLLASVYYMVETLYNGTEPTK